MKQEFLFITDKERDILTSLILKELRDIENYNAIVQANLNKYKEELKDIYEKL